MRHLGRLGTTCQPCAGRRFLPACCRCSTGGAAWRTCWKAASTRRRRFHDHPRRRDPVGAAGLRAGAPAPGPAGHHPLRGRSPAGQARRRTGPGRAGGPALIALDEPTTGLHAADIPVLLAAWDRLLAAGHTLLVVDNDLDVLRAADQVTDLGPGSGPLGGRVVAAGRPRPVAACPASLTGASWPKPGPRCRPPGPSGAGGPDHGPARGDHPQPARPWTWPFPASGLTVVTGPSGCGKSSLVFDTLLAEAQNRFADLVSPWARRLLPQAGRRRARLGRGAARRRGGAPARRPAQSPFAPGHRHRPGQAGPPAVHQAREPVPAPLPPPPVGLVLLAQLPGRRLPPVATAWASSRPAPPSGWCPSRSRALGAGALDGTRYSAYLGEPDGHHLAVPAAPPAGPGPGLRAALAGTVPPGAGRGHGRMRGPAVRGGLALPAGQGPGVHPLTTPWPGFLGWWTTSPGTRRRPGRGPGTMLAEQPLSGLPGRAAQPPVPGRHLPGPAPARAGPHGRGPAPGLGPSRTRRLGRWRRNSPACWRAACGPWTGPAWATWPRTGRWPASPAARPSGRAWPPPWGRGWRGSAMCWTSPPAACTPGHRPPGEPAAGPGGRGQRRGGGGARSGPRGPGRPGAGTGARRRSGGGPPGGRRHPGPAPGPGRLPYRPPAGAPDPGPGLPAPDPRRHGAGGQPAQPARAGRHLPGGRPGGGHGRFRQRQVHPGPGRPGRLPARPAPGPGPGGLRRAGPAPAHPVGDHPGPGWPGRRRGGHGGHPRGGGRGGPQALRRHAPGQGPAPGRPALRHRPARGPVRSLPGAGRGDRGHGPAPGRDGGLRRLPRAAVPA